MSLFPFKVSVVVPSYNRAHLLERTLPSYLQRDVGELILVDDCSTDNTSYVVAELQKKYPQIHYIRNERNSRQCFSKNVGIRIAQGEYIYFGDDDSILTENSISVLLETMVLEDADMVGARALYMGNYCSTDKLSLKAFERWQRHKNKISPEKVAIVEPFTSHFNAWTDRCVTVKYLPACLLCKSIYAKEILFDENYTGCAYREETDFCIRATFQGLKLVYEPKSVQINLPSKFVKKSGAHSGGKKIWLESALECNQYFFDKNWNSFLKYFDIRSSKENFVFQTEKEIRQIANRKCNPLIELLKLFYFRIFIIPCYGHKDFT